MNIRNRSLAFPRNNQALSVGIAILAGATVFTSVNPANAAVILSTDFNGRTISGATASNLNWTTNGVSNPGDLTANFPLFNTAATQNLFAVQRNLHTQGTWTVDIPVVVGSQAINLTQITLDNYIFNAAGDAQPFSRDVDLTLELLDNSQTTVASVSVNDLYPNSNTIPNNSPVPVTFNFTGNTLQANTTFFLRLTASGQGSGGIVGTNSGIDNFVVNGDLVAAASVPEPSTVTMLGAFVALSLGRFCTKKLAGKRDNQM